MKRLLLSLRTWAKLIFFQLKADPKAREALRPMFLALFLCVLVPYVAERWWFGTLANKVAQLRQENGGLRLQLAGKREEELALQRLSAQVKALQDQRDRLAFKHSILALENQRTGDPDSFRRIILGLGPDSPQLRSFGLIKVVSQGGPPASTTRLQGELKFPELLQYLAYLEGRREIGYLAHLTIVQGPCSNDRKREETKSIENHLCFEVTCGKEPPKKR